jgi:hypothetical protein
MQRSWDDGADASLLCGHGVSGGARTARSVSWFEACATFSRICVRRASTLMNNSQFANQSSEEFVNFRFKGLTRLCPEPPVFGLASCVSCPRYPPQLVSFCVKVHQPRCASTFSCLPRVAWHEDTLYVAAADAILMYPYQLGQTQINATPTVLTPLDQGPRAESRRPLSLRIGRLELQRRRTRARG